MERENLSPRCKGRRPSGSNRKDQSTEAGHRGGAARRREEGSVMELDQRGCSVPPRPRANRYGRSSVATAKPFSIPICMGMAEHREPYDARVSRTVLGARGGETPPRDSPGSWGLPC